MTQLAMVDPLEFQARLNLADALFERAAFAAAAGEYRKALEHPSFTSDPIRLNAILARAYYRLGAIISMSKQRKEAIEAYKEALQLKPDYTEARRALEAALAVQRADNPP